MARRNGFDKATLDKLNEDYRGGISGIAQIPQAKNWPLTAQILGDSGTRA